MISTLKKHAPEFIKEYYRRWKIPKWKGDQRIFLISFQRTGTTSFGDFFEQFGYPRAGYAISTRNQWSKLHYENRYEDIFSSHDFNLYQVFEDNPWWAPNFYKVLYEYFPESKFVLQERDSKAWFASMIKHSGGRTLGNTRRHARIYEREDEFNERLKNDPEFKPTDNEVDNLMSLIGMDDHYIRIYENHIRDAKQFFSNNKPDALLVVQLEDPYKWQKIGKFIGFDVPEDFDIHSNKSIVSNSV